MAATTKPIGDGYVSGNGYGYGYGYVSGYGSGYGYGYGYGDGDGSGYGYGYGDGDGSGYGSGYGSASPNRRIRANDGSTQEALTEDAKAQIKSEAIG